MTPTLWPGYYSNVADIHFHEARPDPQANARFSFSTSASRLRRRLPNMFLPLPDRRRAAWHLGGGDATTRLDVIHAWLFEDLPGGRVRILTQVAKGVPARTARTCPIR